MRRSAPRAATTCASTCGRCPLSARSSEASSAVCSSAPRPSSGPCSTWAAGTATSPRRPSTARSPSASKRTRACSRRRAGAADPSASCARGATAFPSPTHFQNRRRQLRRRTLPRPRRALPKSGASSPRRRFLCVSTSSTSARCSYSTLLAAARLGGAARAYGDWFNQHSLHFHTFIHAWPAARAALGFRVRRWSTLRLARRAPRLDLAHYLCRCPHLVARRLTGGGSSPVSRSPRPLRALARPSATTPPAEAYLFLTRLPLESLSLEFVGDGLTAGAAVRRVHAGGWLRKFSLTIRRTS